MLSGQCNPRPDRTAGCCAQYAFQGQPAPGKLLLAHLYKGRNAVEPMFCRLKNDRSIAARYDKLATNFSVLSTSWPPQPGGYESEAERLPGSGFNRCVGACAEASKLRNRSLIGKHATMRLFACGRKHDTGPARSLRIRRNAARAGRAPPLRSLRSQPRRRRALRNRPCGTPSASVLGLYHIQDSRVGHWYI